MPTTTTEVAPKRLINGAAVRALRDAIGIAQQELALRAGLKPQYLCNIEAGRKQPSPQVARAIATTLGVPLDAITYVVADANVA